MPHEQPLAGERILIVDDEHIIVLDLVETLTRAGASTLTARNPKGALRCLRESHVSLAVLDIRLGENEDCSAVSDELARQGVPFIFLTGYATPPCQWKHIPMLTKPARPSEVIDALYGICTRRHAA